MTGTVREGLIRAEQALVRGEYGDALELVETLAAQAGLPAHERLACLLLKNRLLVKLGELEKALALTEELLQATDEWEHPLLVVDLLTVKAEASWRVGRLEDGLRALDEGEALLAGVGLGHVGVAEGGIERRKGELLGHRGIICWYKGDLDRALENHQQSRAIKEGLGDRQGLVDSFNNLGLVYWSKGDFDQALEHYRQSLAISEELGKKPSTASVLTNMGNIYARRGDLDQALACQQRSLAIKEELGQKQGIFLSLINLGVVYQLKGELDRAEEYYQRSLDISEELGIRRDIALAINNLGNIDQLRGALDQALQHFQRSLAIYRELGIREDAALLQSNIGEIQRKKGNFELALEDYEQSLAIYEEMGNDTMIAIVLSELVSVALERQDPSLAERYLQQLQQIDGRTDSRSINQRYRVARALFLKSSKRARDKLQAEEILEQVVEEEVADHALTVTAMIHLCDLWLFELKMTGEDQLLGQIKDLTHRLLEIARQQSSHSLLAETYLLQSKLALVELDLGQARALLEQALTIAEERGLRLLARTVAQERDLLQSQVLAWQLIIERKPSIGEMIDLTQLDHLLEQMAQRTVPVLAQEGAPDGRRIHEPLKQRYRLDAEIGRGSMGKVYRATDLHTGELVAVKALDPGVFARDPGILERFVREGEALRQLNHPNIVRMVAAVEDEGRHYLVMEYVAGGSLQDLLDVQGALPAPRVMEIALDLADALTRAHRLGIVHRDLKPANVLLAEDGTPRLTDFGIARVSEGPRLTETGVLMGTPDFLSPEACNGQALDERTDIWAFGVLLFEMLAGGTPFPGDSLMAKLTAILTQPVPDLGKLCPEAPQALVDLICRMLEKDRQQRIPSVRLVGAELEAILKGRQDLTTARPAPAETGFTPLIPLAQLPSFLEGREPEERPIFVAREQELTQLDGHLDQALSGQGRVVFVTGEAGQGKTALIGEFARRAQGAHPNLIVAGGNCNAHTGIGDPYLPFREILGLLTGDVQDRWAARAISQEQARRLWQALPLAVQALVEAGPDLIDLFVPGPALVRRAQAFTPWPGGADGLPRLQELVGRKVAVPGDPNLEQAALFEQYTRVLQSLAGQRPLLLLLDDLQWADVGSTNLLFHLGRHVQGSHLLIVGAYRPAEVALGRLSARSGQRERHPLEPVVNELKRYSGRIEVDLEQAEDRQFVEALLDTPASPLAPNRLGDTFRETLYQQTGGHPLSTVELLRNMQERGDLVRDREGRWVMGPALDWETLPVQVEAVIAERMSRLPEPAREALRVASVEGEAFTAEVVARVLGLNEREMVRQLGKLDREHRLVMAQGIRQVNPAGSEAKGGQRLSLYRFRHILFQRYLYNSLSEGERVYLHEDVGLTLETLHGGVAPGIAALSPQLARHFLKAGILEKAVGYLIQAGDRARALYAHQEATDDYLQAVAILRGQGLDEQAARTLMKLGLVYTAAFEPEKARVTYDEAFALWQPLQEARVVPEQEPSPAVLRFAVDEPLILDPAMATGDPCAFMATQLFEGLVRVGQDNNVLPAQASHWQALDQGTRYLFHLRKGLRWNDGTPLTAADFEYAWKRNLDPATGSPLAHQLYVIQNARAFGEGETDAPEAVGVTARDDGTLEVRLEGPTAYLLYLLASPIAYPLSRRALEHHGPAWSEPENLVSNGAYELVAWERGERLELRRNRFYYGRFPGNVERVECTVFAGYGPALEAYAGDRVDAVSMLMADPATIAQARATYGRELVSIPSPITFYLIFRTDSPPFDDLRTRRAFVHAVDRETLVRQAFTDQRLPALGGFVPPGMPGHSPRIGLRYDPEQARRLLAQAGYPEGAGFPTITWLIPGGPGGERLISCLRSAWRQHLGLDLDTQSLYWEEFQERMHRDPPHLALTGWSAGFPDPHCMLHTVFHTTEGTNRAWWYHPRFDALLEEAARVTDQARRLELYGEADRILVAEEAVIMPLTYGLGRLLVKPWVSFPPSPSSFLQLSHLLVRRESADTSQIRG
jgi:ABC-type oligopeptide transport system substrate-binding subunit/Tfp pilus assembly protein PilF